MCDLYCGKVPDEEKWDEARIGHYIGIGKSVYLFSYLGFYDNLSSFFSSLMAVMLQRLDFSISGRYKWACVIFLFSSMCR